MSPARAAKRGRGVVEPAWYHVPEYYKTYGPEVADLCSQAHFAPDPQQALALDMIFARRSDGLSAAFEVGLFVCRQNLKTGVFKQAGLGWLFLFDERLIVYSAHEFITAMEMFRDMEQLVTGADFLRREVKRIIRSHGEEAIELNSGARMIFKTRTKGGGRGLSGRKVVLDEGFALRPMHMGALLPTLSAQPDPQVLYGSSAGMADSDVIRDVRDRGRAEAGADPRLAYLEWCAPDPEEACDAGKGCSHAKTARGCGCDKPDLWLKSNPAIGDRISVEYIAAERRALPVSEFCRERMGWWDDPLEGVSPMSVSQWVDAADRRSTVAANSPVAIAFDVQPDSAMAAIALAGWRADPDDANAEVPHVELVEHLPGTGWLLDRLLGIVERQDPCVLVLDPGFAAGAFEKALRNKGFVTKPPNSDKPIILRPGQRLMHLVSAREYAQGCGSLTNAVTNGKLWHPDQAPLNGAVEVARARPVGGAWGWDSPGGADITPIVAVTLANVGLAMYGKKKPPPQPFVLT